MSPTAHWGGWVPLPGVRSVRPRAALAKASQRVARRGGLMLMLMQVLRASNASDQVERSAEWLVRRERIEALLLARSGQNVCATERHVAAPLQGLARRRHRKLKQDHVLDPFVFVLML